MAKFVSTPTQNFDNTVNNTSARKFAPGVGLLVAGIFSAVVWIGVATLIMGVLTR